MEIIFMKLKLNRKGSFLTVLGIIIIIVYVLFNMSLPHYDGSRTSARQKACFSNQRIIEGAIEMYNMDNKIPIETALPGQAFVQCEEELVKSRYLKNYIELVEPDCSYGFFDILGSGTVFCKAHGSYQLYPHRKSNEDVAMPSYDTSLEIPLSKEYLEKQNKKIKEKKMRDFSNKVSSDIVRVLISPVTGLLIAIVLFGLDIAKGLKIDN